MARIRPSSLVLLLALAAAPGAQSVARDGAHLSPFRGMRMAKPPATGLEVQVTDDRWHELVTLQGIPAATLLAKSQELCGDRAWKRLTEL